jgi:hypothetical protein
LTSLAVTRVRKPKWTKEKIVEALRAWEKEHDRRPVLRDCPNDPTLPAQNTFWTVCESWAEAYLLAFGESPLLYANTLCKDEDTRLVIQGLEEGRTLTDMARERGVTQQSLGKRVAKYRGREYEAKTWVRNPHAGRTPNRKDVPTPSDTASG